MPTDDEGAPRGRPGETDSSGEAGAEARAPKWLQTVLRELADAQRALAKQISKTSECREAHEVAIFY